MLHFIDNNKYEWILISKISHKSQTDFHTIEMHVLEEAPLEKFIGAGTSKRSDKLLWKIFHDPFSKKQMGLKKEKSRLWKN